MMKYIDAHCHILSDAQMRGAAACGVGRFVVNATGPADWNAVIDLAWCENVYGAIGVHPWFVADVGADWELKLIDILKNNARLMVGEIGLDKNRSDFDIQQSVFIRQIQIAHDMSRVAHIHCVGAWGKMLDVLRSMELPPAMVFHGFSGAPELVADLVDMGAYLSFGANVRDTKYKKMRNALVVVPENRILVESDAPDVSTPDRIPNTVAEIARIRDENPEHMAKIIFDNTMGVLNDRTV